MKATMSMCQTLMLVADDDLLSDLDQIIESKMPSGQGAKQMKLRVTQDFKLNVLEDGRIEAIDSDGVCLLRGINLQDTLDQMHDMIAGNYLGDFEFDVIDVIPTTSDEAKTLGGDK